MAKIIRKRRFCALRDALWHNSLTIGPALGFTGDAMIVDILVGVAQPEAVDTEAVAAILPYGTARVKVVEGGLDIVKDDGIGAHGDRKCCLHRLV